MATNGCFGHLGQYDVSEDIHIGFPMYNNMGINTKIKSLAKLTDLAILAYFQWPKWPLNGHVGHPGQPKVSENGPFLFPMFKNMGIDTKIKSLACLEPSKRKCPHDLPIQVTVPPQGPPVVIKGYLK